MGTITPGLTAVCEKSVIQVSNKSLLCILGREVRQIRAARHQLGCPRSWVLGCTLTWEGQHHVAMGHTPGVFSSAALPHFTATSPSTTPKQPVAPRKERGVFSPFQIQLPSAPRTSPVPKSPEEKILCVVLNGLPSLLPKPLPKTGWQTDDPWPPATNTCHKRG